VQQSLPYRQNVPDPPQFPPPPPPVVLPAQTFCDEQIPKQHSAGSSPGVVHGAPETPQLTPPSLTGGGVHAVCPVPSSTQLFEQHESS
jgi:hypothetical protein